MKPLFRFRNSYLPEQFQCFLVKLFFCLFRIMNTDNLLYLFSNLNQRIQRRHRILENHGNFISAD